MTLSSRRSRAVDISTGVGAAYTAKLLADIGWDVVKIEPPSGDPLRTRESRWGGGQGGAFTFVNAGKRGVVADPPTLLRLVGVADVVVGDLSPAGLREAELPDDIHARLEPRVAIASVTPFGLTGTRADWVASDLIVQAASGLMFLTGEWDEPPMQLPPYQGALTGGLAAAGAILAAMRLHRRDGQRHDVDVSMVEALASYTYSQLSAYVYRGEVARREPRIDAGVRMVPASDRFIYCAPGALSSMKMDGIAELIEEPRLAEERFQTAEGRMQNYDEFVELFVPPFKKRTAQEWFEAAGRMHLTFALVQTIDDLFFCPQLSERGLLREVTAPSGARVRIPGRPFKIEGLDEPVVIDPPRHPGSHTVEIVEEWLNA